MRFFVLAIGDRNYPGLMWNADTVPQSPLGWFFTWLSVVSWHTCADQYSNEFSRRDTLQLSGLSVCISLLSVYICSVNFFFLATPMAYGSFQARDWIWATAVTLHHCWGNTHCATVGTPCPVNSCCLVTTGLPASSPQPKETICLYLRFLSLHHGLKTYSKQWAGTILGLISFVAHLWGIIFLHCLLFNILSTVTWYILFNLLVVSRGRINPVTILPSWPLI